MGKKLNIRRNLKIVGVNADQQVCDLFLFNVIGCATEAGKFNITLIIGWKRQSIS
jgi:hypothetical protein